MKRQRRFKAHIAKADAPAITPVRLALVDSELLNIRFRASGATLKAMGALGQDLLPILGRAIQEAVNKSVAPPAATTAEATPAADVVPTRTFKRAILSKAENAEEERYVLGIVMEPGSVDTQGQTENAEEIRKACFGWMEAYRTDGEAGHFAVQHARNSKGEVVASDEKFSLLENYIQKSDEMFGEEQIKSGSWVMAIRVKDDSMWEAIKSGDFTGFSIGGTAVVNELN